MKRIISFMKANRKTSYVLFLAKGSLLVFLLWFAGHMFAQNYSIGIDPQLERCIPTHRVFLVERKPAESIERDGIYLFLSKDLSPFYKSGTKMLKHVRGMPGDVVNINTDDQIVVNGKLIDTGLYVAGTIKVAKEKFQGTQTLKQDEYWFMGTSPRSFDSRYWGPVKRNAIISRAYPIF